VAEELPSIANPWDHSEATVATLLAGYRQHEYTVADVVAACWQRIDQLDRRGPTLNAMISLADNVDAQVEAIERSVSKSEVFLPLYGVPVVIKDNINVAGLPTTGGCAALRELIPTADAEVVARLKAAGAIILGKSSMSEFAWGTYDTQNSVIDGYTRNPYDTDYAAGGSSGGSGVAVAAGYCVAALGTDTGCSVRAPASINGLVGLRPTHGLISMKGVMPMNADWDTVGPMARTLEDLAVVLDVITGSSHAPGPYVRALAEAPSRPARVGVLRQLADPADSDPGVVALLDQAATDFESAGAVVIDPVSTDVFDLAFDAFDWYLRFRFDLDVFLEGMGADTPLHSLAEVLDTGLVLERYLEPLEASFAWPHRPEQHPRLAQMNGIRDRHRHSFTGLLEQHNLDALAFPTFRFPPVRNGAMEDRPDSSRAPIGSNNYYASLTGFPALSVPMGYAEPGLPVGLQLLGRPGSEARLLQAAHGYEQHTQHRRPPAL
jgi:Asp-tRNA(Asn)/Glu-tRNA(Gln) amidotransferase A subunit family amidase